MKKNIIFKGLFVSMIGLAAMQSCKKDSASVADDITETMDNSAMEGAHNDVDNLADEAQTNSSVSNYRLNSENSLLSSCATVTNDTVAKLITIDFGSTNCLCKDGRYRRGKILVQYSGRWRTVGASQNISFDNYYVNDNRLLGTKSRTFKGPDGNGNYYWDVIVNGLMIPSGTTDTVRWNSTRTVTWIQGYNTPLVRGDDVFTIDGSALFTGRDGLNRTINITKSLRKEVGCRWIVSGTMTITRSDKPTRTLDYGNGSCDAEATVTVNGNSRQITLR
jgi:hypothetical protein